MTPNSKVPLTSQAREDSFPGLIAPFTPSAHQSCRYHSLPEAVRSQLHGCGVRHQLWLCSADSLLRHKQLTLLFVCSQLSNVLLCVSTWHKSRLCISQWDPRGPWQNNCMAVDEGLHSNNCFIWKLYCFPSVAEAPLCPKSWCFTFAPRQTIGNIGISYSSAGGSTIQFSTSESEKPFASIFAPYLAVTLSPRWIALLLEQLRSQ